MIAEINYRKEIENTYKTLQLNETFLNSKNAPEKHWSN